MNKGGVMTVHRTLVTLAALLAAPMAQASSTVDVGQMEVNGQEVRNVKCTLGEGGIFAIMGFVGQLANHKETLDACVPAGAAFRLEWKWVGGKTKKGKVAASRAKPKNAGVVTAMQKTTANAKGSCSAVILVGDATGAGKAADALQ